MFDGVGGISEGGDLLLISGCLLWLRQTKSKFSPGSSPATEHQVRQVASVVTADKERARWVTHDNPYLYFLTHKFYSFVLARTLMNSTRSFIFPLSLPELCSPLWCTLVPGAVPFDGPWLTWQQPQINTADACGKLIRASIKCNRATLLCRPRGQIPASPGKQNELDLTRESVHHRV